MVKIIILTSLHGRARRLSSLVPEYEKVNTISAKKILVATTGSQVHRNLKECMQVIFLVVK